MSVFSLLDFEQIITRVYDEAQNRLRVDMGANITLGGELEVSISAADGDSVIVSDGTDNLNINADGSINTVLPDNTKIQIWDGTDNLNINSDGSLNVNLVNSANVLSTYNEVTSVPSSTLTSVVSYTASGSSKLKNISASGTNISTFQIEINASVADKKRTYFGSSLNVTFDFKEGISLDTGDVVTLKVVHNRPYVGDFNGRIQVEV